MALLTRLSIGFGFLFLGLDFMKGSVESFAETLSLTDFAQYGLWVYLLVGICFTALMQASAATIAIVLTALNSGLITFDIGAVMVIGANIGSNFLTSELFPPKKLPRTSISAPTSTLSG